MQCSTVLTFPTRSTKSAPPSQAQILSVRCQVALAVADFRAGCCSSRWPVGRREVRGGSRCWVRHPWNRGRHRPGGCLEAGGPSRALRSPSTALRCEPIWGRGYLRVASDWPRPQRDQPAFPANGGPARSPPSERDARSCRPASSRLARCHAHRSRPQRSGPHWCATGPPRCGLVRRRKPLTTRLAQPQQTRRRYRLPLQLDLSSSHQVFETVG